MDYRDFIVITNRSLCEGDFLTQIKKVATLHPYALILREKDLNDYDYLSLCKKVMPICEEYSVTFFVHQRLQVAKEAGCVNIHLSTEALRKCGKRPEGFEKISVACHSLEDIQYAQKCGATQIILGTIFETECKKGLKGRGVKFVKDICKQTDLPVYAIGGIKEDNILLVKQAGAKGGCMMSGFMNMRL